MQWNIIIGPLIGALIGYITNWIAVKMLFRPLKPVYIGKFRVPFTPGIIPKGKARLAKSIGTVVGDHLLAPEMLKNTLSSPEMQGALEEQLELFFQNLREDNSTVEEKLNLLQSGIKKSEMEEKLIETAAKKVNRGLLVMNIGKVIAEQVQSAVQEKAQGTIFAMLLKAFDLDPVREEAEEKINQYIMENGEERIGSFLREEYAELQQQSVSALVQNINMAELKRIMLQFYQTLVGNYAEKAISALNLPKIAEEKVNAMDTHEVEDLILSIMKNELGAVVNLGAIIGFILGLLNLLF